MNLESVFPVIFLPSLPFSLFLIVVCNFVALSTLKNCVTHLVREIATRSWSLIELLTECRHSEEKKQLAADCAGGECNERQLYCFRNILNPLHLQCLGSSITQRPLRVVANPTINQSMN